MNIAQRLIKFAEPLCQPALALGYNCLEFTDGSLGIAWTPDRSSSGSCTHLRHAGSLLGLDAREIVSWLDSENMLEGTGTGDL